MASNNQETLYLQQVINGLSNEVQRSRMEAERSKSQLECLMTLVRRAWLGDPDAATQVATIVGAAPPDLQVEHTEEGDVVKSKLKSPAVNNWAKLTIGLLNREYKQIELEMDSLQHVYLANRNTYLDDEIVNHEELMTKEAPLRQHRNEDVVVIRHNPQTTKPERPISCHSSSSRLKVQHLYRPAHGNNPRAGQQGPGKNSLKVGDLFVKGCNNYASPEQTNKVMNGLYHMTRSNSLDRQTGNEPKLSYDHPARYTKSDLFEVDEVLGDKSRRRPPTASSQRSRSNYRVRPKSSIIPGRPPRQDTPVRLIADPITSPQPREVSPETDEPPSERVRRPRVKSAFVRRPDFIDKYQDETSQMRQMEEEFRRTAFMLQKKLGLPVDGMI